MKKTLLFIFIFLIFWINTSFAWPSYTASSWIRECEWQTRNNLSWQKFIPTSNNTNAPKTWTLTCVQNMYFAWQRSSRKNKGIYFSCPNSWYASLIQRSGNKYRIFCKIIDTQPPQASDVSSSLVDNWYHKANKANIDIVVDEAWWSPIVKIEVEFEDVNDETKTITGSSSSWTLSIVHDYSKIDINNRNDVTIKNYRPYSYKITKVCDEAWNCSNDLKTFTYNIYANNIDYTKSSITWTGNFDNQIADWTNKNLNFLLKDTYWNKIIPVHRSWGILERDISIKLNYDNDLYLNQYTISWDSAVLIKWQNDIDYSDALIQTNVDKIDTIYDISNISWDYNIDFKIYTPTYNNYDKATWWFKINTLDIMTSGSWWNTTKNIFLSKDFDFKPLYEAEITWDIKNNWLSIWTQLWQIEITKNWTINTSDKELYLEFGSWNTNKQVPKLNIEEQTNTPLEIWEWHLNKTIFKSNFSDISYDLKTFLTLSWWVLEDIYKTYLSTHISYTLDWKNIVYNTDIIWKNNYWWPIIWSNLIEKWVKVIWKTHSKKQEDVIIDQNKEDIHVFWNIQKSSLKRDIRKKVFNILKSVSPNNWGKNISDLNWNWWNIWIWDNSDWITLQNDKILYFWDLNWDNVELSVSHNMEGKKTIVIVGGNLYIKSNIVNNSNNDILWIIVLKDKNGKWWNIYIHPDITRIDGILYVDKSLMSYYGWAEIDAINNTPILANQLYIYWSIFSENTSWGFKTLICPYYVVWTCGINNAPKYDLNTIRAYRIKLSGWAANWWINYFGDYDGSWTNYNWWPYTYYKYPITIKYNLKIQTTPPPLFNN